MITNPRAYFNFFLTKNDRHNAIQREAMNCEPLTLFKVLKLTISSLSQR